MNNGEPNRQEVVVTDIHMRFTSMVVFMLKWAIAAIPALLILVILAGAFWSFLLAGLRSIGPTGRSDAASTESESTATTKLDAEAASYLPNVVIRNARVSAGEFGQTGVFGEVKNNGSRTLKKVEIVIYCLGPEGKPVFEKSYPAVLVSSLRLSNDDGPLKPGYSRQFGVKMEDAPSDWNKKVDVKVTKIEFQ